jgi:hypothetical protein
MPIDGTMSGFRTMRFVAGALVVATGTSWSAYSYVANRTSELNAALSRKGGVAISIGSVDAGLTATVRLSDIRVGELFSADAFEARVAFSSLLNGEFGADEISVEAPRLNARIHADGNSELKDLVKRFSPSQHSPSAKPSKLRRVVVSRGELTIALDGGGEVVARDVEIEPTTGGVRVVTGRLDVGLAQVGRGSFASTACDLQLPTITITRGIAIGGSGTMQLPGSFATAPQLALRTVVVSRKQNDAPIHVFARIDDHGTSHPIQMWLQPERPLAAWIEGTDVPLSLFATWLPSSIDVNAARASGSMTFAIAERHIHVEADAVATNITIRNPRVDDSDVVVSPDISLVGNIELSDAKPMTVERIAIDRLRANIAPAVFNVHGDMQRSATQPLQGNFSVDLEKLDCAAALAAVPAAIRGPLDGLSMSGWLQGGLSTTIDLGAASGSGVTLLSSLDLSKCAVATDPPLADVTALRLTARHTFPTGTVRLVGPDAEGWVSLDRVAPKVYGAFTAAEDGRFFSHHGFDLEQIARSLEVDLRDGKFARGGSTISQQLVKNSFLTQRRSFGRKFQEAVLTWRMENALTKREILERYLNIIELGPEIFGVGAAARFWFDLPLRDLAPRQAAFLAALTSEPKSMTRRLRAAGTLDPGSAARVDTILRAMRRDKVITDDDYIVAKDAPLDLAKTALTVP